MNASGDSPAALAALDHLNSPSRYPKHSAAMVIAFAIFCFVFAAAAASIGIVTEYRQTRAEGPVAIVGTMQWAPVAAVFTLFGLLAVRLDWWWCLIAFVTVLVATSWTIIKAGKRGSG